MRPSPSHNIDLTQFTTDVSNATVEFLCGLIEDHFKSEKRSLKRCKTGLKEWKPSSQSSNKQTNMPRLSSSVAKFTLAWVELCTTRSGFGNFQDELRQI
ncbi:hypothetical protein PILCRDRAFT_180756 [Piloderma croceum F 1598]|uniref:Uncharacterized protein n=1 Tax=Piloderma croceum (strain F 1598) TaxID=765440 RepID=A0A0C3CL23_PILCF|nr:hypothetical protein PILCRDRAFT_180756 [Piloderma croceum F 1598]